MIEDLKLSFTFGAVSIVYALVGRRGFIKNKSFGSRIRFTHARGTVPT